LLRAILANLPRLTGSLRVSRSIRLSSGAFVHFWRLTVGHYAVYGSLRVYVPVHSGVGWPLIPCQASRRLYRLC
jgi:hypothetical protein